MRYKTIVLLLFMAAFKVNADPGSEIYHAYISGNIQTWKSIIDKMSSGRIENPDTLFNLINYQYGYIGYCVGNKSTDEAKKYLEFAENNLEILEKSGYDMSMINAYKAAFYGYRISIFPMLAPVLGGKSVTCAREAIKLNSNNPFAYLQTGHTKFYMPHFLGGSKSEALEYYLKALDLMEKNTDELTENWNYLSLLIVISQSYSYLNDFKSALHYREKILTIAPEFAWVKNELYKQICNKMKSGSGI